MECNNPFQKHMQKGERERKKNLSLDIILIEAEYVRDFAFIFYFV